MGCRQSQQKSVPQAAQCTWLHPPSWILSIGALHRGQGFMLAGSAASISKATLFTRPGYCLRLSSHVLPSCQASLQLWQKSALHSSLAHTKWSSVQAEGFSSMYAYGQSGAMHLLTLASRARCLRRENSRYLVKNAGSTREAMSWGGTGSVHNRHWRSVRSSAIFNSNVVFTQLIQKVWLQVDKVTNSLSGFALQHTTHFFSNSSTDSIAWQHQTAPTQLFYIHRFQWMHSFKINYTVNYIFHNNAYSKNPCISPWKLFSPNVQRVWSKKTTYQWLCANLTLQFLFQIQKTSVKMCKKMNAVNYLQMKPIL